jgi:methionine-rich copper-binding protein CopC
MKKVLTASVICLVILAVFSCGKDKPPTGGPKDTTPPEIIDFEPGNLTRNFHDDEIMITFTETIDERSFEDALHIYPPMMKKKITSGKQRVTITFKEELKQDQTYLITIDTRCKDLRDNSLEKVHSLIFSTSDRISAHKLNVNLELDERATERQGMYFLQLYNTQDTIFITSQNAEELQNFTFDNLPSEEVSVIAFLDENKNSYVDKKRELFDEKIVKLDDTENEIKLTLALQDTTKPVLKKVVAESAQRLTMRFSEDITQRADCQFMNI